MNITEIPNNDLEVHSCKMDCDADLAPDLPIPLDSMKSGSALAIIGHSGSGKTTLMVSLLSAKKKKGVRQSFRKLFDNVVICSPSLHTLSTNVFKSLDGKKKFNVFDEDVLDYIDELTDPDNQEEDEPPEHTLLILDDVSSQLRSRVGLEKRFVSLLQNRRHKNLTCWIVSQKFRDLPTGIRNNLSHFITFRPKNVPEAEAIYTEMMPMNKKYMNKFYDYCFSKKHGFLLIDMSLRDDPAFKYYRNFNRLRIEYE